MTISGPCSVHDQIEMEMNFGIANENVLLVQNQPPTLLGRCFSSSSCAHNLKWKMIGGHVSEN